MSVKQTLCPRCNGKGKAKLKDVDTIVNCPTCGGIGYLNNDFLNTTNNNIVKENTTNIILQQQEIGQDQQILILKQIIKNPDLFLAGIKILFADENKTLFIYLKNQHIFDIENQKDGMLIKLKQEFKNNLAKQCIEYLTRKKGKTK